MINEILNRKAPDGVNPTDAGRKARSATRSEGRWDVLLGMSGFFLVMAFISTVAAEFQGRDALAEAGFLALVTSIFGAIWFVRRRRGRRR